MRVLALGGSIRAMNPKSRGLLLDCVRKATDLTTFRALAAELVEAGQGRIFSNTEILAGAALMGAKSAGADVEYFPLARLFGRREKPLSSYPAAAMGLDDDALLADTLNLSARAFEQLRDLVKAADSVILCSPVYFGDRSSVANKVLQIASREGWLEDKVVGMVSCGAKRNGGQETTNIFALSEALAVGAFVAGNGAPCAQYGGTAVAGDPGRVLDDKWGLETAFGTGMRSAQVAAIVAQASKAPPSKEHVDVVVICTMDTPARVLENTVRGYAARLADELPNVKWHVVPLVDGDIERCLGCGICPVPELLSDGEEDAYACIIQSRNDTMAPIRERLRRADAVLIAGLSLGSMDNVIYRYQAFTERTRFIRRNDFELTNVPVAAWTIAEAAGREGVLHFLKVMTSYMRHNMVVCPPITEVRHGDQVLIDAAPALRDFLRRVSLISRGRTAQGGIEVSYKAGGHGGYADNRLDHTTAVRT